MTTPATSGDSRVIARVERQLDTHGRAKVLFLPLTALAAVGSALSLLGNDWVLLVIVLAVGASAVVGLFWAVERHRYIRRDSELTAMRTDFETYRGEQERHAEQLARHNAELDSLQELIENVNWAVQRIGTCCYRAPLAIPDTAMLDAPDLLAALEVQAIRTTPAFEKLEEALLDLVNEAVPGRRRVALYYGDPEVVPFAVELRGGDPVISERLRA